MKFNGSEVKQIRQYEDLIVHIIDEKLIPVLLMYKAENFKVISGNYRAYNRIKQFYQSVLTNSFLDGSHDIPGTNTFSKVTDSEKSK